MSLVPSVTGPPPSARSERCEITTLNSLTLAQLGWDDSFRIEASKFSSSFLPGRVAAEHRGRVTLWSPQGTFDAPVHRDDPDPPRAGDWVLYEPQTSGDLVRLRALLPRRSALTRKAVGRVAEAQVVVANVDVVFVTTSCNQDLNPRRIERYLALTRGGGASPVLLLTKTDLAPADVGRARRVLDAVAGDAPVIAASALWRDGLDEIRSHLAPGRTAAFVGSSGVGKSTILNQLMGADVQAALPIREHDQRGVHTTTTRSLHLLPNDQGLLLDTPGMRELGLHSGDGLDGLFDDIDALAARCRFRDCQHEGEPGCAVQEAIEEGQLDPERLMSHNKLAREALWQESRTNVRLRQEIQQEWARRTRSARTRTRR